MVAHYLSIPNKVSLDAVLEFAHHTSALWQELRSGGAAIDGALHLAAPEGVILRTYDGACQGLVTLEPQSLRLLLELSGGAGGHNASSGSSSSHSVEIRSPADAVRALLAHAGGDARRTPKGTPCAAVHDNLKRLKGCRSTAEQLTTLEALQRALGAPQPSGAWPEATTAVALAGLLQSVGRLSSQSDQVENVAKAAAGVLRVVCGGPPAAAAAARRLCVELMSSALACQAGDRVGLPALMNEATAAIPALAEARPLLCCAMHFLFCI